VRKFCDGLVIFKVIKKPLQKRLSQVIRRVVIQTLFEKPGREEHALKKCQLWRYYAGLSFWECAEQKYSVFLKTGKSSAIDYPESDFIFIAVSLRVLKHLRKIMKNVSLSFIKSSLSVWTVLYSYGWLCVNWNWKFLWKSFPICNVLSVLLRTHICI